MKVRRALLTAAVVCVFIGVSLIWGYSAVRFTGMLFCLTAGAVLLYAHLHLWGEKHRAGRVAKKAFAGLIAAGLLLFFALEAEVLRWARTDSESAVSAVIVLGAGVNGTEPSLSLRTRLEAALDYIADKPGVPIVVTGSQGPGEDISEAECMRRWLVGRGVDPDRILLEDQADDTEQNIAYSKAMLHEYGVDTTDNIAVVSSDYHLARAAYHWGVPWMVPVAAAMPEQFRLLTLNYFIREAFALAAEGDALFYFYFNF